ncbi:MAG: serine/threonine-protein kinase, partial [Planctomycetaceae bacterium]
MPPTNPNDPSPRLNHGLGLDVSVVKRHTDGTTDAAARSSLVEADACDVLDQVQTAVFAPHLSPHEAMDATYVPTTGTEPMLSQPHLGPETVLVPGYRVLHEIARGGMGRVLAAHDMILDRDVALKVLLPGASADRFIRESKITARLPHPGIPPVHALGTLADGSPFLAMKLIVGQTLAAELKTANQPRLLQMFAQVCQAVGFAHSRGVIHRDLKPANVMVGAFGEVQVMDWGLARDLPHGNWPENSSPPAAVISADQFELPTIIQAAESTDDRTQAGAVMGTPAYMAPEQARGEEVDTRADVFALGGILCALLTGQPPFVGKSSVEVIQRAAAGNLADANARLDACGADAELVTLCRQCLNQNSMDRPADGQKVADALTSYLNGVQERLQVAERERAVTKAREVEQRKRRRAQLALAAALLVVFLGFAAFAWWQNEQSRIGRERAARNGESVTALLNQCQVALRGGDAANAEVALSEASKRYHEGGADAQVYRLNRLDADLDVLRDLYAIEQFRWTPIKQELPDTAVLVRHCLEALPPFGAGQDSTSPDGAAKWVSDSVVSERIVIAMDWLLMELCLSQVGQQDGESVAVGNYQPQDDRKKIDKLRAVLRQVDADPFRDAVRDSILSDDLATLREWVGQPESLEQPPGFAAVLGACTAIDANRRRQILEI